MTTLSPRALYAEDELKKLYPPNLELQQVQILLRHGERTPVSPRFQNAGLPAQWPFCQAAGSLCFALIRAVPNPENPQKISFQPRRDAWRRQLESFGPHDQPVVTTSSLGGHPNIICDNGMLTFRGRVTTWSLGARLRHLYVDQLGFLPGLLDHGNVDSMFYLRSTSVPRALESLQQVFEGLYPYPTARAPQCPSPTVHLRGKSEETLYPNESICQRFGLLRQAFARRTAERWNRSADMEYLNALLGRWMPAESPRVAVDSKPRLNGIMDTVNSVLAHRHLGVDLPGEFFDRRGRGIMERIVNEEWFSGFTESREYRALGIGALMGDIMDRMLKVVDHDVGVVGKDTKQAVSPIRLGLSGCHDTTIAGILASLGAFDMDRWPPFTSHVAIELFRKASMKDNAPDPSSSALARKTPTDDVGRKYNLSPEARARLDDYYVRIRYNDEVMTVPGCSDAGRHLEGDQSFCTLAAFKSIVDQFTPKDWVAECKMNLDKPAFPPNPEPAGYAK